jgi:hypothetical protein
MSVLDAFIHDPLVEWEDEKRKLVSSFILIYYFASLMKIQERVSTRRNNVAPSVDLVMLAKGALSPIQKKLKGRYSTSKEKQEKEVSTSNLVEMIIQEASNPANLVGSSLTISPCSNCACRQKCTLDGLHGTNYSHFIFYGPSHTALHRTDIPSRTCHYTLLILQ